MASCQENFYAKSTILSNAKYTGNVQKLLQVIPQDMTLIAINVDNFQEAYDFFIGKGFIDPRGGKVTDTSSSRATMLVSPSGFAVSISEHLK